MRPRGSADRWRLAAATVAVAALASASCSTSGDDPAVATTSSTSTSGAAGAVTSTTARAVQPHEVVAEVGTSFQYKEFVVTVGHVVHDPEAQVLRLAMRYQNRSGGWAQTEATGQIEWPDGTTAPVTGDLFDVPPGATVDVTAVSGFVPLDSFEEASLVLGSSSYAQPSVRLDGEGGEDLWLPVEVPLDEWGQIGKFGVHVTGVQVNASQVDMGIQAVPGELVMRVLLEEFTARGTTSPFDAGQNLLLRRPDGETVKGLHGSPMASEISWTAQGDQWVDFPVSSDVDGRYELLLGIAENGFGVLNPDLIERRSIPFEMEGIEPGAAPEVGELPFPAAYPVPAEGLGDPVDVELDAGAVNLPGFDLQPTRLRYDPASKTATLDTVVRSLEKRVGETGGILSADPTFDARLALASGGRLNSGYASGDGVVSLDEPNEITFTFSDVRSLDPADVALYAGPSEGAVSSLPLGPASAVPAWPPRPVAREVVAPEVTAGDWTVQFTSYRIGLVDPLARPRLGRRQLELELDVTASPTAQVKALGLSFQPKYQVLLGSGTGYDQAAVADSGFVEFTPGQSESMSVTFEVPDNFRGGRIPVVVRSNAEYGEIPVYWIEVRLLVDLTDGVAPEEAFE